jgi:hypothetical protein
MADYSYNGWPASPDKASIGVVANDWFPGGVKAGDVTTVLRHVVRQLDARVEPIVAGWCWGYTYKANVNNPSQLSCHASGTALDFNAVDHPNGSSGTFTQAQVGEIYAILAECRGAVGWLEGYDEMHFEIQVDAADLARVAALLGDAAPPEPEPEPEPPVEDDDVMQLLRIAGGDGKIYAASVAGRRFYYVGNADSLVANQLAGTYAAELKEIDQGQLNHVRYACQIQTDDDPAAPIP